MSVGRFGRRIMGRLLMSGLGLGVISFVLILLLVGLVAFVPLAAPLVLVLSLGPALRACMRAAALVAI